MRNVKLRNISANYSSSPQDFEAEIKKKEQNTLKKRIRKVLL